MTVVARRVALGPAVEHALAPTGSISATLQLTKVFHFIKNFSVYKVKVMFQSKVNKRTHVWPPASLPRDPADLCLAVGALEPVAAPLLEQQHLAVGAVDGVALVHQVLNENAIVQVKALKR